MQQYYVHRVSILFFLLLLMYVVSISARPPTRDAPSSSYVDMSAVLPSVSASIVINSIHFSFVVFDTQIEY